MGKTPIASSTIQYQVLIKPSPKIFRNIFGFAESLGIRPEDHDIRFVEDNWESPTLGAWGWLGNLARWNGNYPVYLLPTVWRSDCRPVSLRLRMGWNDSYVSSGSRSIHKDPTDNITYGDVHLPGEIEHCNPALKPQPNMLFTVWSFTSRGRATDSAGTRFPSSCYGDGHSICWMLEE